MKLLADTLYSAEQDLERDSVSSGVDRYRRLAEAATKRGDGSSLQPAERLIAAWFPALESLIDREVREICAGMPAKGRGTYGRWLLKLSPEKCAAITLSTVMSQCLAEPDGVTVAKMIMQVSSGVMGEWNYERIMKMKGDIRRDLLHTSTCRLYPHRINSVAAQHIVCGTCARLDSCKYALDPGRWPLNVRGHVGSLLLNFMLAAAQVPGNKGQAFPAFTHSIRHTRRGRLTGYIEITSEARQLIDAGHTARQFLRPKYQPMLVRPGTWTATDRGGYVDLQVSLIKRTRHGAIPNVIHQAVNSLNATPWRINKRILNVVQRLWDSGGNIAEIPPKARREMPPLPAGCVLSTTQFRKGRPIIDSWPSAEERLAWKKTASFTHKSNTQEESERVNWVMKLDMAQRMSAYERFYFPHQLDFRGRAYSVPLFLNHQGDDVCRGLMEYANPVTPGGMGEYWLQIHLANSCGIDKVSFADRVKWVEQNEDRFRRWRSDPLTYVDWTEVDKPFQALAAAYALDDKESAARMPVQLDGSNNALQHYAAMLRDEETAVLVNLIQSDLPQDFYADVTAIAQKIVGQDAATGHKLAIELEEWINRKLIKQTAMTTFYKVTEIGARRQLRGQLNDAGFVAERQYHASKYLASIVLKAVSANCPKVHEAMRWLSKCAAVIAASGQHVTWTTPLGLEVTQPYKRTRQMQVKTILQKISLRRAGEDVPVAKRKQVQGFPPNFVHGLDASHLMTTAVRCAEAGIDFAGVHDCYWSHAGNIPVLNAIIREEFVKLHNTPQLHALAEQFKARYPALSFPEPPTMGNLDVDKVLGADYSFC